MLLSSRVNLKALSKELKIAAPKSIPLTAVEQVLYEIEEAISDSNTLMQSISRIEECCQLHLCMLSHRHPRHLVVLSRHPR